MGVVSQRLDPVISDFPMLNDSVIMALGMSCRPVLITSCHPVSIALVETLWLFAKNKLALCLHTSESAKWKAQVTGEECRCTHMEKIF